MPIHVRALAQSFASGRLFDRHLDYRHFIDLNVAVERKLAGGSLAAGAKKGLSLVASSAGF